MTTPEEAWRAWHTDREQRLRTPHGWLSLTAIHWLTEHDSTFDGVPGAWRAGPAGVTVTAAPEDGLVLGGEPVIGSAAIDPSGGDVRVEAGPAVIEVIQRDGAHAIRVRDPHAPARTGFTGVPIYPYRPEWALAGRYEPFDNPRTVLVDATVEGIQHQQTARGVVHFTVAGTDYTLTVFQDDADSDMVVLFRDATSGVTTYGGVRSLVFPPADGSLRVVLDFNRATNLPCAFTDFATCPLPPPENVLRTLAIEAGELKYH